MSFDRSQLPAAYGEHWGPEAIWQSYDGCGTCFVGPGVACRDTRYKHAPAPQLWKAHPRRPLLEPTSGKKMAQDLITAALNK